MCEYTNCSESGSSSFLYRINTTYRNKNIITHICIILNSFEYDLIR